MQPHRFERFDPVTVRAAARVLRVGRLGRITFPEVRCFLQHLADLHPGQRGAGAVGCLERLARWRASFGDPGVPAIFRLRRVSRPLVSRGTNLVRSGRDPD
jgi:hypothetical protein